MSCTCSCAAELESAKQEIARLRSILARMKHRSDEAHGLLFAAIKAAFKNWPEKHRFHPESPEHLRAWLLCEVGHVEFVDVNYVTYDVHPELAKDLVINTVKTARSLLSDKLGLRMYQTLEGIRVVAPRSIDYRTVGKREFNEIAAKIYDVIQAEIGVDAPALVKQDSKAA